MKKKLMALVLCLSLGMTMFGCGKDNKKEEETKKAAGNTVYTKEDLVDDTAAEVNVLDYVELAEFTGIDLTKEVKEVTEEDVQTSMETNTLEMISEGVVVADGDTTVIDFEGKLDGVAFDGGTGKDYTLVIGSNSFIDGFEDGLIGVKKGETVDLNLTFPEDYKNNKDLAGKAVVFTVTVKEVKRVPAELTDEWLAANTKYASVAEYQAEVKTKLEQDAEDTAQYNLESSALDHVITNSTVKKYFKSFVDEGETQYENYINTYASYYGMDLSAFISAQGMTNDEYKEAKAQQGISYAKAAMIVQAVAKTAGFTSEDEKYQEILADVASQYGMDAAALTSAYGESLVSNSVMSEYVMEYIASNANVTTKVVSGESETTDNGETEGTEE